MIFVLTNGSTSTALAQVTDGAGRARLTRAGFSGNIYQVAAYFGQPVTLPGGTVVTLDDPLCGPASGSQTVTVSSPQRFFEESAWINYSDQTAPGATADNRGHTSTEIFGKVALDEPGLTSSSILATPKAGNVTASIRAPLSGRTIADGTVKLGTQSSGLLHWRGETVINGVSVQLFVDWASGRGHALKFKANVSSSSWARPLLRRSCPTW